MEIKVPFENVENLTYFTKPHLWEFYLYRLGKYYFRNREGEKRVLELTKEQGLMFLMNGNGVLYEMSIKILPDHREPMEYEFKGVNRI